MSVNSLQLPVHKLIKASSSWAVDSCPCLGTFKVRGSLSEHFISFKDKHMIYTFIFTKSIKYAWWKKSHEWKIPPWCHLDWCCLYTGCSRRNVPDFGRVFLMLKYTDITQNTYIQGWTVTEIMAREVWNFDSCYTLSYYQIHIKTGRNMWFL